ncbi:MAG TPA: DUF445 domain-containing protein [Candidatus Lumbricidophila sp.]|nr:DUF445 domain-containing protein [Candidatus Lumbricidophila sp.]
MATATITDSERHSALQRMKRVATAMLIGAAVVFAVAYWLQDTYEWAGYLRAAAEGAMVGAIADWFAVTALFRHPLGLKIPHTAIIPTRKNEIGATLGSFVEHEFLSDEVVRRKLSGLALTRRVGAWLTVPANAERVAGEASRAGLAVLNLLSDDEVESFVAEVARRHLFEPEWAPAIGRLGAQVVAADQQRAAVDALLVQAQGWLTEHPGSFGVSHRLPAWVPKAVHQLIDDRVHAEALHFVAAVRDDPHHPLRGAIDRYLAKLADDLQHEPAMIARIERIKRDLLESPRVREFSDELWAQLKAGLSTALADPNSALRAGFTRALADIGGRLATDTGLQHSVDAWATAAASDLVARFRGEIAGVITETVERWDPRETTEKLELQVGRDLQFIRINGTVVGALAGLAISAIAVNLHALF